MSEQNAVALNSVPKVIEHLKGLGDAAISAAEVVTILEGITSRKPGERRGQLAGVTLEDMSLEQLKREKINASSVLYKAQQRGASAETIAKNQARVDAVVARIAELTPAKPAPEAADGVYTEGEAAPADHAVEGEV